MRWIAHLVGRANERIANLVTEEHQIDFKMGNKVKVHPEGIHRRMLTQTANAC